MATALTLDVGLDFGRLLPGEVATTVAPPPVADPAVPPRRLTLDDLVAGVWEGLRSARPAACPICHGVMEPRWGSGPAPVGGRCRDCGTVMG